MCIIFLQKFQTFLDPVVDDFQDLVRPVPVAEGVDVRRLRIALLKQPL